MPTILLVLFLLGQWPYNPLAVCCLCWTELVPICWEDVPLWRLWPQCRTELGLPELNRISSRHLTLQTTVVIHFHHFLFMKDTLSLHRRVNFVTNCLFYESHHYISTNSHFYCLVFVLHVSSVANCFTVCLQVASASLSSQTFPLDSIDPTSCASGIGIQHTVQGQVGVYIQGRSKKTDHPHGLGPNSNVKRNLLLQHNCFSNWPCETQKLDLHQQLAIPCNSLFFKWFGNHFFPSLERQGFGFDFLNWCVFKLWRADEPCLNLKVFASSSQQFIS